MVTCHVRYQVNPERMAEFEAYGRMWFALVARFGGVHHGYFLPREGDSPVAVALYSFDSLEAYQDYRRRMQADADCQAALRYGRETQCFLGFEHGLLRPVLPD